LPCKLTFSLEFWIFKLVDISQAVAFPFWGSIANHYKIVRTSGSSERGTAFFFRPGLESSGEKYQGLFSIVLP
jgi:hypothetical protein